MSKSTKAAPAKPARAKAAPRRSAVPDNAAQIASPSFRLAALDQDFMLAEAQRGIRFQLEYAKAEANLQAWGVRSTVVVFGSARTREDGKQLLAYALRYFYMHHRMEKAQARAAGEKLLQSHQVEQVQKDQKRARAGLDQGHPKAIAFLDRIHARPAYQRALEKGGPYTVGR